MRSKLLTHLDLNFSGKTVLITGGTRGIGLETALAFAQYGAQCVLTYNWGGHDEAEIEAAFSAMKGKKPFIVESDASNEEMLHELMIDLKNKVSGIDIFISNVSKAAVIKSFQDYALNSLKKSISYSAWPLVGYTLKIQEVFKHYPKYIMAVSSTGPDQYSFGYDFVAASKAVLECMCKYLNYRLRDHDVVINAIRSRAIKTQSLNDTFGKDLESFASQYVPDSYWIEPREISQAILGLCSGYCDAISGQVISVDRGTSFFDNLMDIYTRNISVKKQE